MAMQLRVVIGLVIAFASATMPTFAQAPAVLPGKVRIASTAADALCVGATTVSPAATACTGGLYVGPVIANGVVLGPNGSTSAPTFAFANDTNTGIYSVSGDVMGFVTGGTERFRIGAGGNMVPVGGNSYNIGDATNTIRDIYVAGLAEFANGSNSAPSITFLSDTDTGMYRVTTDVIGWTTAGTLRWGINGAGDFIFGASSHIADSNGTPTIGSGFGTSPSIAGTDYAFVVTLGSGAGNVGGSVTFGHTFSATVCTASGENGGPAGVIQLTTLTTSVSLSYASGTYTGAKIFVLCRGY